MEHRLCKLRDVTIGQDDAVNLSSPLALVHFECLMDVLMALYNECTGSSSLSKDKNITKFIQKFERTISEVQSLRVNVKDFEKKCTIGRGHYGEVQVVKEKSSGQTFAMKVMRKADILKNPDVASILEERDIMAWARSPWLTSLKYSFQDTQHLYIVMDFFPGGDLFSIIEKEEGLDESAVKFYLAEIASGLNDLHCLGFVHRDVKPENVLIAGSGHVRLVDFGVAARVVNGKVVSSQLPVGTPSYLAPEVLQSLESSDGYGVECDWWSLGIIAYELMVGVTPFEGDTQKETYDNIMNYEESLEFPDEEGFELSTEFQDLIRKLCSNSANRLSFEQIKQHSFFAGVDWDHLLDATPPYIPNLNGPDDTSHFEQIKTQQGSMSFGKPSRPQYGFNGQSLYFVGFTHSKFPSVTSDHPIATISKADDAANNDLTEKLQKSEEERRKLVKECAIYQSQLEDLHRQLEMEKLDRRSTDAKTLQLLSEVKEQGQLVQEMKETETRNTVDGLQKVMGQMEQDQAMLGKKVHRLQESLKSCKKEAEQSKEKSNELEKKLSKLKGTHQKELSSLQAKLLKVTRDGQGTISELRKKLAKAEDELLEANYSIKQLRAENTSLSRKFDDSKELPGDSSMSHPVLHRDSSQVAIEGIKMAEMELRLENQRDDLEAAQEELTTAQQEMQNLKTKLHDMDEQVHLLTDEKENLETEQWNSQQKIKDLMKKLEAANNKAAVANTQYEEEKTRCKKVNEELKKANKELQDLTHSYDLLHKKVTEFESRMSRSSSQEELVKAVQSRNVLLEGDSKRLSAEVASFNSQLEAKDKEMVQLREDLWKEKAKLIKEKDTLHNKLEDLEQRLKQTNDDLTKSRSTALELRKTNRELEKQMEATKDDLTKKSKRLSTLNQNLEVLSQAKTELLLVTEKRKELETSSKALKEEVQQLKNNKENDRQEYSRLYDLSEEVRNELEAEKLTSAMLQQKVDSLESDLLATKSAEQLHKKEEASWSKAKETLENDLEAAETMLDTTKIQLETEQKLRQQAEAKLKHLTSHHETTETVSQHEVTEWKEKYEQSKEKAKEYSELLSEVKQRNAVLEVELKEIAYQLTIERQLSSKLHDQYYSEHREHNILKATHMKLAERSKQAGIEQEMMAKQQEQQLDQLREQATEQTKMQVTIAQQNKLIDYLQDKTPTHKPTSRIRQGLKKMIKIKRSRDPSKEMEDWNKFKGFLNRKSSAANSPTGSCFGKSPSSRTNEDHMITAAGVGSVECLTSSPSTDSFRSTRSATASARGGTPLKEMTLKQCQVNLPRSSSAFVISSPPAGSKPGLTVTSPKRKSPSSSSSSSTIKTIEHNIPHKFSSASISMQSATCAACKTTVKRGHKSVKCKYCKVACHPKCAGDLPNTCGLPAELADHLYTQPPLSKKAKIDNGEKRTAVERVQLRKEGWLQVYHAGKSAYYGSREWVVISDDSVSCYSRMDINREATTKTVKALLPLHNPSIITILHSTLKSDIEAPISSNKINQAFAIEQFREDGDIMTYFVADSAGSKKEWTGALESILQEKSVRKSGKNLKEVSVVPMDIDTPMLLRSSKSSISNKSLTSNSNSSDERHQETTE